MRGLEGVGRGQQAVVERGRAGAVAGQFQVGRGLEEQGSASSGYCAAMCVRRSASDVWSAGVSGRMDHTVLPCGARGMSAMSSHAGRGRRRLRRTRPRRGRRGRVGAGARYARVGSGGMANHPRSRRRRPHLLWLLVPFRAVPRGPAASPTGCGPSCSGCRSCSSGCCWRPSLTPVCGMAGRGARGPRPEGAR